jgi:hypothetical protein
VSWIAITVASELPNGGHDDAFRPRFTPVKPPLNAADLSPTRALEELRRIAFSALAGCFDATGTLLPIAAIPAETRTAVASVKVVKRNLTSRDGRLDEVHAVRFWDKVRALEVLAKHLRAARAERRNAGSVDLVQRLQAARLRGKH